MNTKEIADRLVKLCREGDFETCYNDLYSNEAISLEPKGSDLERAEGMDGIREKGKIWQSMIEEFHGSEIGEPIVAGSFFSVPWTMEVTYKGAPGPTKMEEIAVYEVKEGKVVSEQFFYPVNAK